MILTLLIPRSAYPRIRLARGCSRCRETIPPSRLDFERSPHPVTPDHAGWAEALRDGSVGSVHNEITILNRSVAPTHFVSFRHSIIICIAFDCSEKAGLEVHVLDDADVLPMPMAASLAHQEKVAG